MRLLSYGHVHRIRTFVLLQAGVSGDEHCKVPTRIPRLTAERSEAFRTDIEHGRNVTTCGHACGAVLLRHLTCRIIHASRLMQCASRV